MLSRAPQNLSVPDTLGRREPIPLQWINVGINEIETVPLGKAMPLSIRGRSIIRGTPNSS